MSVITQSIALADGRSMEILLGGDPVGYPLVMHHGTPADATTFADWHEPCLARGIRLICASRPGYAASTRMAGRSVAQVAGDVSAILDCLGHTRFMTAGWSGGGPHALACAALLSDRCAAAATLAGVGPFGKDVLVGGYANLFAAMIRRSLERGFDGWIDDDLACTRPWGFSVGDIRIPVTVWQGELDLAVPFAHGRWLLGNIPGAVGRMVPGHGHFSLVARYRDQVLEDLQRSAVQAQ